MTICLQILLIFILAFSNYGSTFIALPRPLDGDTLRLSPQDNYAGEFESRLIPIPFGGFGLFQNKQKVKTDVATLQTQVAKLNADVALLNRQVAQLTQFQRKAAASIQTLQANGVNITTLLNILHSLNGSSTTSTRRCPPAAAIQGGKVVGNICYVVIIRLTTFTASQTACELLSGSLAEPRATVQASTRFYRIVRLLFPAKFTSVENAVDNSGTFWIGYRQILPIGPFIAPVSGRQVASGDGIFNGNPGTANDVDGAAIQSTGSSWIGLPLTTTLPFICRINAI